MVIIMEKTTERKLLIEILSRLEEGQVMAILEDLGRGTPLGEALYKVLEEDCNWGSKTALNMDELKQILKRELEDTQNYRREFFQELIHFADRAEKTDAQIYNAIGMNRALWYRLRDNRDAKTNKRNVLKMAIFLRLDYWETYYLVNLSGHSFLPGNDKTDQAVSFCIRNKIYEPDRIDELLYEAGERTLFTEE
ncbi:hypothetical protein IMSAGC002_03400 [Lachnospiraceae bacterium]|jgi:hypothetical protein|nr:hypothetical protein IMSAGC002_03400 [Lachnospiraceae bacterium]